MPSQLKPTEKATFSDRNLTCQSRINEFKKLTGYSLIVNTSFNVRGEPIVCTPEDAFRCFMRTEMDYLVINDFLLDKIDQVELKADIKWQQEFALD